MLIPGFDCQIRSSALVPLFGWEGSPKIDVPKKAGTLFWMSFKLNPKPPKKLERKKNTDPESGGHFFQGPRVSAGRPAKEKSSP